MLWRLILLLIPLITFLIPSRWFNLYALVGSMVGVAQVAIILLLHEQYAQAFASFGIEVVIAYIVANLLLLGVRYLLIRRNRMRTLNLPAPTPHE